MGESESTVGYIVGYYETWADDMNPIIVGYYTIWDKALTQAKRLQRINIDSYNKYRKVYVVEVEPNKTYDDIPGHLWANSFDHYVAITKSDKTILEHNRTRTIIEIVLPPSITPNTESVESEWQDVRKRRTPRKVKRPVRPPHSRKKEHRNQQTKLNSARAE